MRSVKGPAFFRCKRVGNWEKVQFFKLDKYICNHIYIYISGYFYTPPKFNSKTPLKKWWDWVRRSGWPYWVLVHGPLAEWEGGVELPIVICGFEKIHEIRIPLSNNSIPSRERSHIPRHSWVDDFPNFRRWDMLIPWRVVQWNITKSSSRVWNLAAIGDRRSIEFLKLKAQLRATRERVGDPYWPWKSRSQPAGLVKGNDPRNLPNLVGNWHCFLEEENDDEKLYIHVCPCLFFRVPCYVLFGVRSETTKAASIEQKVIYHLESQHVPWKGIILKGHFNYQPSIFRGYLGFQGFQKSWFSGKNWKLAIFER